MTSSAHGQLLASITIALACTLAHAVPPASPDSPVKTEVIKSSNGHWQLLRGGKPYFVKGGGGGGSKQTLLNSGGNSFRTWGVDGDFAQQLEEAQKLGLTVSAGVWLGHKDQGFDYTKTEAVKAQFEMTRKAVLRFKNSPALLLWSLGNEMENGDDSPTMWKAIEDLARMVKQNDPNHPTMTVIAEIGGAGEKVQHIQKYCPDIDIIGVNSYGGGPSVAARYKKCGGTKPFILTEFGPPGAWEIPMNSFGAAPEMTSTEKANFYAKTYTGSVLGAPDLCLGSYAFTWGYKVEATPTWFGMLLPDGSRLGAVDALHKLWTGKPPEFPCPAIGKIQLAGKDQVNGGDTVHASLTAPLPSPDVKINWLLVHEQANYAIQDGNAEAAPQYPDAIAKNGETSVSVKLPAYGGIYRLYCFLHDSHNGAAVANVPIKVTGPDEPFKAAAAKLPFYVYAADKNSPYIASGWMGNTGALRMDPASADHPRSARTSLKIEYTAADNWAGIMWQSPANDWGEKPGGFDLTGAKTFSFWARGAKGGEKVQFGYGGLGPDKKFHDSASGNGTFILTPEWKHYTLDLAGKDLSCIKTGFSLVIPSPGAPIAFYLDDIRFE